MTKSIFLRRLLATLQFVLGFIFGISLIAGVAASAGYLYFKKMSTVPEKPVFSEEMAKSIPTEIEEQPATTPAETTTIEPEAPEPEAPEPETPEPEAPEPETPELPSNAYMAQVTWPQGLSLRSEPSLNAARVGGISYNAKIIILEDSADGKWQKVRLPWSEQEGWVKGGNTKRISY